MATESPHERSNEATLTSDPEPVSLTAAPFGVLFAVVSSFADLIPNLESQTIKIDSDSQNVEIDRAQVNGDAASTATDEIENKHISDIVDDLVNSAEVSVSGGSDTEASRTDVSRLKDDDKGHGRSSSSVKKPASFKSISVNKTFLTTKGATPGTPVKATDKGSAPAGLSAAQAGTASSAARPRLVAKSGPGLVSKSSGLNGGKPGSAPDANAVWNKNRRK